MPRQTLYRPPHPQLEPWPPASAPPGLFSDEPARQVYLGACQAIGDALAVQGFRYARSKQRCTRGGAPFTHTILFQSSHYNSSGRQVVLWMHATVQSSALLAWRRQHLGDEPVNDHVAGGMVHLLGTRYAMLQWELAAPRDRPATIQDAVDFLNQEVLPYFARFTDLPALIHRLATEALPGLELVPAVELALWAGDRQQAQAVLDRFLRERPDIAAEVERGGGGGVQQ